MPGSHIGLLRLQSVCSPCVVRKRCRSSTDCAFTQESATDLWLFTTNTTFIHYFDFKSTVHRTVIQSFIDGFKHNKYK